MTNKDVFLGLEALGFDNIDNMEIYSKDEPKEELKKMKETPKVNEEDLLYDKEITCPVCGTKFKARAVKTNSYRMISKGSDFYINYHNINPYFYDVILCNACGYAQMKSDFNKIKHYEIELIQKNVATRWQGKRYPAVYDVNMAIERYKLSLLNATMMGSKFSKKAMICLKLAWMFRELKDEENEKKFIEQALIGFNDAYFNEQLPVYGMDKFTILYLLGELNRRLGKNEEALRYFGEVITSQGADRKIKDLATDQKDLIREVTANNSIPVVEENVQKEKKPGLIKRLLNI